MKFPSSVVLKIWNLSLLRNHPTFKIVYLLLKNPQRTEKGLTKYLDRNDDCLKNKILFSQSDTKILWSRVTEFSIEYFIQYLDSINPTVATDKYFISRLSPFNLLSSNEKKEKLALTRSDVRKKQRDLTQTLTRTAVRSSIFLFHAFSDEFQIVRGEFTSIEANKNLPDQSPITDLWQENAAFSPVKRPRQSKTEHTMP